MSGGVMPKQVPEKSEWVHADFNGMLERDLLCLAHTGVVKTFGGRVVTLAAGMRVTAFDNDSDEENRPDDLFASGVVELSPQFAQCRGSVWSLRIDEDGIRHELDIKA